MLKGAKPGQRRGGRQRGKPNRTTILRDRILALAAAQPSLPVPKFLVALTLDPELPADIVLRVLEYSERPVKGRKSAYRVLDTLLRIARDPGAARKDRESAAKQIAKVVLPETSANPRWRYKTGRYEFWYSIAVAKEYRDLQVQWRQWEIKPTRLSPSDVKKLKNRREQLRLLIVRRPPPIETYGEAQILEDRDRLMFFEGMHDQGVPLTEEEDGEEIERLARFDSFRYGPQVLAAVRRGDLENHVGLTQRGEAELMYLRTFFPKNQQLALKDEQRDKTLPEDHPFNTEAPCSDGCFRPAESDVHESEVDESLDSSAHAPGQET